MKRLTTIAGALVLGFVLTGCATGDSPGDIAATAHDLSKPNEGGGVAPASPNTAVNAMDGAQPGKKNEAMRGQQGKK